MNLTLSDNEACYRWLIDVVESVPKGMDHMAWNIPSRNFYTDYCRFALKTGHRVISPEDFWDIIQLTFPNCELIGAQGNRAFTGIRKKLLR